MQQNANEKKEMVVHELATKPETWDAVAETYNIELEDGDYRLASDIEKLLLANGLRQGDSLIEMGCGSGHLSACLAMKGYKVTLVDFSPIALEKARLTFERYGLTGEFIQGDLFELDEVIPQHDYAWNSGVMEHFGDVEIVELMKNISCFAKKGVLYLVPNSNSIAYLLMRARLMANDQWPYGEEYLRKDYDTLLKRLGYKNINKSYVSASAISAYQMWKAEKEQGNISELYRALINERMLPPEEGYLVAYFASNSEGSVERTESVQGVQGTTVQETKIFDLVAKKIGYDELKAENIELKKTIESLQEHELKIKEKLDILEQKEDEIHELESVLEQCKREMIELDGRIDVLTQTDVNRVTELEAMNQNLSMALAILNQKDEYMIQTQNLCNQFATGKLMQLNHFLFRVKGQLLHGGKADRKDFWAWLGGRAKHTNRTLGAGVVYNPWMVVNEKLKEAVSCRYIPCGESGQLIQGINSSGEGNVQLLPITKKILKDDYCKNDVIILSVIDYNFRHQRPQHFATRYAANGHRVFYVNANFVRQDSVTEELENLYVVDFENKECNAIYATDGKDTLKWMNEKLEALISTWAIRDAVIIVDYPNWVYGAEEIKKQYGFQIVTDYMDDYTGFLGTAEDFLKDNCIHLLQASDLVVASSQFLYDVASKHTDAEKIEIVRNGTEVDHFYQAKDMGSQSKNRKVIGYYGAVSHWFAWEKICYLAKNMPECDIVIVGEVTEYRDKLEKYDNIKLLGEKKYQELPKYLADFDVCLIPFDTSTDLIKATNPVKFYEYLSAGKKVVATEIPELMPYRDEYVYMSNDDEKFAEYVKMCLEGTDGLKAEEDCITFAKENDWQHRFEAFAEACVTRTPMVSVVVLTYNNKAMNKQCIDSILQKTAYANYELIVVDNHSTDDTVDYLKELDAENIPNVTVILNDENLGFAGGNNCGMDKAKGDFVILLNNDTVVTRGWITGLVKHLVQNEKYGMCNPVTNSIGNESQVAVKYRNLSELQEFSYQYTAKHMGEEYKKVERLPLFSTIIRKDVIEKVGTLDSGYKVGMFEDDDYTERVINAGYSIVIAEDSFVHHINNGSFKKLDDEEYKRIFEENKKLFEKKWNKKWQMPKYRDGVTWDTNKNEGI